MIMMKTRFYRKHGERGQVLILALIALLILTLAIFLLLDISNVIRAKVKSQNAVDAAALTGANWQRHTLNLIGELNLVKATTVLISDSMFGTGMQQTPDSFLHVENEEDAIQKRATQLKELEIASDTVSQIQQRALFIVPLIGFGAAQQTAKNNGLNYNKSYGEAVRKQMLYVENPTNVNRKNVFEQYMTPDYIRRNMFGYNWKAPYLGTLDTILLNDGGDTSKGIAVLPNAQLLGSPRVKTVPPTGNDFAGYLQSRYIYDAIQANYWCWLKELLRMNFDASNWWGNLVTDEDATFRQESEYLPVGVEIKNAQSNTWNVLKESSLIDDQLKKAGYNATKLMDHYDLFDPVYNRDGEIVDTPNGDRDRKLNPLPALSWAYYNWRWRSYDQTQTSLWEDYLSAPFKKQALYYSGAVSRMDIETETVTVTGTLGVNGDKDKRLGDIFRNSFMPKTSGETTEYLQTGSGENRLDYAQSRLQHNAPHIYAYSVAKPFGALSVDNDLQPPHLSGIVLPVFTNSAIIPTSLEDPGRNQLADYLWFEFIVEYLPKLGTVNSLDEIPQDMQNKFGFYHTMLKKLSDQAWRQSGITWLETPLWEPDPEKPDEVIPTNEDRCDPPHGTHRYPPVLH